MQLTVKTVLLCMSFSMASFSSASDSIAYTKFISSVNQQADSVKTLSAVMRVSTEMKMTLQAKEQTFGDSSSNRLWIVFPDKFRTEMTALGKKVVTIRNGNRMVVVADTLKPPQEVPFTGQVADGLLINTKKLIDNLSGTPEFKVQPGDTTATLEGDFAFNGRKTRSVLSCDLKMARVTAIHSKMAGGATDMKIGYTRVSGHDCISNIALVGKTAAAEMMLTIKFDSLKVNRVLPDSLFVIEPVKR